MGEGRGMCISTVNLHEAHRSTKGTDFTVVIFTDTAIDFSEFEQ